MSLVDELSSFRTACEAAISGLPGPNSLAASEYSNSLLSIKNEIFLSYLQALALRNLNVVRSLKHGANVEQAQSYSSEITQKLVQHRIYVERGVKPLEQKMKYSLDKVVKTASDEDRRIAQKEISTKAARINGIEKGNGVNKESDAEESSSSNDSDGHSDDAADKDLGHRASLTNFLAKSIPSQMKDSQRAKGEDGEAYRPPRISATAMPTSEGREKTERRPEKSRVMDEYISTELSRAPVAEPSIGSIIAAGGRKNKSARQLAEDQERREYEETNLVRLPADTRKERAKKGGRSKEGGFGGEEWRGLGDSLDRVGDVTKRKTKESALDKSRKRRAVQDRPRDDGIGNAFEIKKRRLAKKMR